jgi:hypothetical protein
MYIRSKFLVWNVKFIEREYDEMRSEGLLQNSEQALSGSPVYSSCSAAKAG